MCYGGNILRQGEQMSMRFSLCSTLAREFLFCPKISLIFTIITHICPLLLENDTYGQKSIKCSFNIPHVRTFSLIVTFFNERDIDKLQ